PNAPRTAASAKPQADPAVARSRANPAPPARPAATSSVATPLARRRIGPPAFKRRSRPPITAAIQPTGWGARRCRRSGYPTAASAPAAARTSHGSAIAPDDLDQQPAGAFAHPRIDAVGARQHLRRQSLARRPVGQDRAVGHDDHPIG